MPGPNPSPIDRLRRRLFPSGDGSAGPPRPGTSPEDRRTFAIFITIALGMVLAGVIYAFVGL